MNGAAPSYRQYRGGRERIEVCEKGSPNAPGRRDASSGTRLDTVSVLKYQNYGAWLTERALGQVAGQLGPYSVNYLKASMSSASL